MIKKDSIRWLKNDLGAGFTLAVMLIPQGMGYAMLAGLPPVIGLYAATIPLIIYALLGSSPHLSPGPVAMLSLLVFSGASQVAEPGTVTFIAAAAFMALASGGIQLIMGLFRFGFIVNFISHGVISGFTSASALIIGISQLKHLLGINAGGHDFISILKEIGAELGNTNGPTLILSLGCLVILFLLKKLKPSLPVPLLVVCISTLAVFILKLNNLGVSILGAVPKGFPPFSLPGWDTFSPAALLPAILTISFVGFLESIAVARSIGAKEKYPIDPNKELIGLGAANIFGAFFSAYPLTGGFSRTAVNYEGGAKTAMASLFAALIVILTLLFLTPLFHYMPRAALGAIIVGAVINLIDFKTPIRYFQICKADGFILIITFLITLFISVESGILTGIAISLLSFIWRSANPHTAEIGYVKDENAFLNITRFPQAVRFEGISILRVDSPLFFANTRFVEDLLRKILQKDEKITKIILELSGVNNMDAESLIHLTELEADYEKRGINFYYCSMKGPVRDRFAKAFPDKKISYQTIPELLKELGQWEAR